MKYGLNGLRLFASTKAVSDTSVNKRKITQSLTESERGTKPTRPYGWRRFALGRIETELKEEIELQVQDIICQNCRLHTIFGGGGTYGSYDYEYRCNLDNAYACCRAYLVAAAPNLRLRAD